MDDTIYRAKMISPGYREIVLTWLRPQSEMAGCPL